MRSSFARREEPPQIHVLRQSVFPTGIPASAWRTTGSESIRDNHARNLSDVQPRGGASGGSARTGHRAEASASGLSGGATAGGFWVEDPSREKAVDFIFTLPAADVQPAGVTHEEKAGGEGYGHVDAPRYTLPVLTEEDWLAPSQPSLCCLPDAGTFWAQGQNPGWVGTVSF